MEKKEEIVLPLPSETHLKDLPNVSSTSRPVGSHKGHCSPGDDSDSFYDKLVELLESSGLTLIFNVRETLLDLYLFYLEVTRRGGYRQVGRERKWGEVVIALKLEGDSVKLCAQVERIYAHLLYQFEQLYFYRRPEKLAFRSASNKEGPLRKKRISTASLPHMMDSKDDQKATEMSKQYHMTAGAGYVQQPVLLPTPPKEKKKRRGAPVGRKTAYQIFLKHECARLKSCNEVLDGKILSMAIHSWRTMSETEKQPYVEESKKNKEEIKEAMVRRSKQQSSQDTNQETREEKWSSICGDYHVTLQPEADVALKMTEKAPMDPSFQMDWDGNCSLDFATRESE
ncbi:high mobility group B protein 10-like isoform X2 [Vigna radiata var. radiata]|uniref:High mobility group B protein 10-like isoform X2 n=1 Tax=Vigna radiata var. radiata TaxID=3916 RepID=A0A3Q0FD75_VIGRR|nr:high mobility group B protein 10-like isoform X2 [Vigna radiata var. radiata]